MQIKPGSHLLFIGDSVTDCDRARPVGSGSRAALGHGYVAAVATALSMPPATPAIQVTNMGISGNTIRDLARRWDTDVLALQPAWLSVMIGINDVWRQFDGWRDAGVPPEEFHRTYDELLGRTRPRLTGLVLMSPFFVQDLRSDPMRRRMDEYGAIVHGLAAQHGAVHVDVQAALDEALTRMDYALLAPDRVHPTAEGHGVLAGAFLGAL